MFVSPICTPYLWGLILNYRHIIRTPARCGGFHISNRFREYAESRRLLADNQLLIGQDGRYPLIRLCHCNCERLDCFLCGLRGRKSLPLDLMPKLALFFEFVHAVYSLRFHVFQ